MKKIFLLSLLLIISSIGNAQVNKELIAGYYVLAYVTVINPEGVPAPQYTLVRFDEGPFTFVAAEDRMLDVAKNGLRRGSEMYPVHTIQKVWIYFCYGDGCILE